MEHVYILEPGAHLRKDGDCLKILRNGSPAQTIPATGLKQLVLAGYPSLSGQVLSFLIKKRIDTVFMTPTGKYQARLLLDHAGHVELRCRQYQQLYSGTGKLELARTVVHGKIENQIRLLGRRAQQYDSAELRPLVVQLKALQQRLAGAENVAEIRGLEGFAARNFYNGFGLLIRNPEFSFSGRNRRPPLDPVNALLSFVYTLYTNEVLNALMTVGLDPYLGALHEILSGRPSLACDLVEEWRVFAERLVLALINRKVIRKDDFVYRSATQNGHRPVEMKPAVYRALIAAWRKELERSFHYPPTGLQTAQRWIIHHQSRRLAEWLKEERDAYIPFTVAK